MMDEIIPTLEEPKFDMRRKTHIDYAESVDGERKSLGIDTYLTFDELIALVRELRGEGCAE